jgi:hypothetical protein
MSKQIPDSYKRDEYGSSYHYTTPNYDIETLLKVDNHPRLLYFTPKKMINLVEKLKN